MNFKKGILFLWLLLFSCISYSQETHLRSKKIHSLSQNRTGFNNGDYFYILGETASLKGQKKTAVSLFQQINRHKTGFYIQWRLAQEYWSQGFIKSAETACKQIISQFSEKISVPARLLLARIYQSSRLFNQAMEQYERVLSIFPHHSQALFHQTVLLVSLRRPIPSKKLFLFKNNSSWHTAVGDIYLKQNRMDLAVQAFQRAFQLDSSSRYTAWRLFHIYNQKNQISLFIDFMEKLRHSDAYMNALLGRAYLQQGKRQKVQAHLADLLWDDPAVLDLRAEWTMGPLSHNLRSIN